MRLQINNNLEDLINSGPDAMSNTFEVTFQPGKYKPNNLGTGYITPRSGLRSRTFQESHAGVMDFPEYDKYFAEKAYGKTTPNFSAESARRHEENDFINQFKWRVSQFQPPGIAINTTTFNYKQTSITKYTNSTSKPQDISFSFRIDQNYSLILDFERYIAAIGADVYTTSVSDGGLSYSANPRFQSRNNAGTLVINTLSLRSSNQENIEWEEVPVWTYLFTGVFLDSLTLPSYGNSGSGSTLSSTVKFHFLDFKSYPAPSQSPIV